MNEVVNLDVFVALAILGVIPQSYGTAMLEKQRLELRNRELEETTAQLAALNGAAQITKDVLALKDWAVACCPVFEGPEGYEMHVTDRVTLVRPRRASADDIREQARIELGQTLAAAGAVDIKDRPTIAGVEEAS